jgi:hypothetical protein
VVNIGKHHEQGRHGCREAPDACPAALKEQFNTFGSWMVSPRVISDCRFRKKKSYRI